MNDFLIGAISLLTAWGILSLAAFAVLEFVRFLRVPAAENAQIEREFAAVLSWTRAVSEVTSRLRPAARKSSAPMRHRARWQLPDWVRSLAAWGAVREPAGYGHPPTLVPHPDPRSWAERDRKTTDGATHLNRARGRAKVARQDRWEVFDTTRAVLMGDMRAAADSESTGLIPRVPAEAPR